MPDQLMPENLAKVWYDPIVKGYRLYDKSGNEIKPSLEARVTVHDNWGKPTHSGVPMPAEVEILILAEVVNEEPTPR